MIWSVSTSARSSTAARPVTCRSSLIPSSRTSVKWPATRGRGGHGRGDQVRPAAARPGGPRSCGSTWRRSARPARGCPGSCRGTSSSPPGATRSPRCVNTRSRPSASACRFTFAEPGTTIARTVGATCRPSTTGRGRAQVLDPRVRARADEDAVDRDLAGSACPARGPCSASARSTASRSAGSSNAAGSGTRPSTGATMPGFVPHVTCGVERRHVDLDDVVEARRPGRTGSARHASSARSHSAPLGAAGRPSRYANVVSSGAIIPARAPASIDMLQIVIRPSIESASIAGPAYSIAWPTPPATPIRPIAPSTMSFAVTPNGSSPANRTSIVFGRVCEQRLRREHVLDLGGADPERERAERAVRGGVRVAAHDRHPGLRQPELRPHHVHDPLASGAGRVQRHAELGAVRGERVELRLRDQVADRARLGRDVVIHRRDRQVGPPHAAAPRAAAPRTPARSVTSWTRWRST